MFYGAAAAEYEEPAPVPKGRADYHFFSTHIRDLALDLCDEIVLLSHGELEVVEKSNLDDYAFKEKIIAALKEES